MLAAGVTSVTVEKREVEPPGAAPRLDVLCFTKTPTAPTDGEVCAVLGCGVPGACGVCP